MSSNESIFNYALNEEKWSEEEVAILYELLNTSSIENRLLITPELLNVQQDSSSHTWESVTYFIERYMIPYMFHPEINMYLKEVESRDNIVLRYKSSTDIEHKWYVTNYILLLCTIRAEY